VKEAENLNSNFISSLLARHRNDPEAFKLDDIYYHAIGNVIAGAGSTGTTMAAAVYFLCKQPSLMEKLRKELDEFNGKSSSPEHPSMRDLQNLPYLQAVVKETLRLFPGTGLCMPRVVPKGGLTLAGRYFPEGASGIPFKCPGFC
jgi:cytochrome P450